MKKMAPERNNRKQSAPELSAELHHGLKPRHITMIAMGGVIGAGLFVGSGAVIRSVGPAAFITYALTGLMIVMVMRMLGEMAIANSVEGSFSRYARLALGDWAGFTVAWLYWYFWVIVVGAEAVAGAGILQKWMPDVPLWAAALGLIVVMTATNLYSVRSFGEFEYWFSSIKVAAIVAFLALGVSYVFGLWPGEPMSFLNIDPAGGFLPHGPGAIFTGIAIVVFSMVGVEIATVAAAEAKDPERAVVQATRSVVIRILIFYVGSILLLTTILPWNSLAPNTSPFVAALDKMNIPFGGDAMNFVVLTAVLSCLNSGLYTASRMLFVLAKRGDAPAWLAKTSAKGVPIRTILASTLVGYVAVIAAYLAPDTIFLFLLNSSGAIMLFVYMFITVSQLILRPRTPPERLKVKMWFHPWLSLATFAGMAAIIVMMLLEQGTRSQVTLSLLSAAAIIAIWFVRSKLIGVNASNVKPRNRPV
ncbi:amino acid permease [Phyllobacterium leguminum]|uniref:Gamma-aminobutyrate:proton symporter (AAT family) n=1 Tax=Phyllobacterium leguminum TaxID=314237 RepID=A0A318SZX0_9HYPH|nr:amino acid permease [Phyllobacterium leguminum]PYE86863.1 gamma-aminobutyrate:proton symporter (AAT family) [Phyllobacterium leguminum]